MKHRSSNLGAWAHLARLILAVCVLLGAVTPGTLTALAENVPQNPSQPQDLRIAQGAYLDYQILSSDVLVFNLDVLSPTQGAAYYWSVENEPVLGDVVVEDTGESSRVRYFPKSTVFGPDGFTIVLTSSLGGQARIHISVTIDPAEGTLELDNPDPLTDPSRELDTVLNEEDYPIGIRFEDGPALIVTNWYGIKGMGWTPSTTVTLTIKPDLWIKEVDTDVFGYFSIDPVDFAWRMGHVLEATDGVNTVTYTLPNFMVTHMDVEQEFIRGMANPGAAVRVSIIDDEVGEISQTATSDDTGVWHADFSGIIDIVVDAIGIARLIDDAGNQTVIYFNVKNPTLDIRPEENIVHGSDWPYGTAVTLEIGVYRWNGYALHDGGMRFFYTSPYTIQPGQILRVTDGVISRSYRVPELEVAVVDAEADRLSGTAYHGKRLVVYAYTPSGLGASLDVAPDASGFWEANFSGVDIVPGTHGNVRLYDDAGNVTRIYWSVPDPVIMADPEDDYLRGLGWPVYSEVSLTVDNVSYGTEKTDWTGRVHFALEDVRAGQLVTMTSGTYKQTYVVANLAVEEIDETADILRGTANPGEDLTLRAYGTSGRYDEKEVTANAAGDWVADFSKTLDIGPGSTGNVEQVDSAGNYSQIRWRIPGPSESQIIVYLNYDVVTVWGWTPGAELLVSIGDEQWTITADNQGMVLIQTPIEPGDVVQITDGKVTEVYIIANLSIVDIDESQNLVSGTAGKNQEIIVEVGGINGRFFHVLMTANEAGEWLANFSGFIDIGPGTIFRIIQEDGRNLTVFEAYVPNPSIEVFLQGNRVFGTMWPPNEDIKLEIAGHQMTMRSSPFGEFYFDTNPLVIQGKTLVASGGGYTFVYEPWMIGMPKIDLDADVISGYVKLPSVARANTAEIQVRACDPSDCVSQYLEIDPSGYWEADFSGVIDIVIGTHGELISTEGGNGITRQIWQVYGYYFPIMAK